MKIISLVVDGSTVVANSMRTINQIFFYHTQMLLLVAGGSTVVAG